MLDIDEENERRVTKFGHVTAAFAVTLLLLMFGYVGWIALYTDTPVNSGVVNAAPPVEAVTVVPAKIIEHRGSRHNGTRYFVIEFQMQNGDTRYLRSGMLDCNFRTTLEKDESNEH